MERLSLISLSQYCEHFFGALFIDNKAEVSIKAQAHSEARVKPYYREPEYLGMSCPCIGVSRSLINPRKFATDLGANKVNDAGNNCVD